MLTWVWIVFAVLVVVLLLLALGRRAAGGVDPTQLLLDPELVGRVRVLAKAGQTIPAIKMLRQGTPGLGLAAAKQMVDKMAASSTVSSPADQSAANAAPSASVVPLEIELEARSLKSDGNPVKAIKLVREHTGFDLAAAKDYVDGL